MFKLPATASFGIRSALVISIILAVIKAVIGFASGSLAILGSALDSLMDMFVSAVNAIALKLSEQSGTKTFAYGLGKVQGFAAIFEGGVVFASGVFLAYNGIMNYLAHKGPEVNMMEISAMIIAMIGTGVIMWNFLRISKVTNSLLIKSDALHYSSDLFMNGGILIALLASKFFGLWWCDAVFAIGIGLWIIKNALPIIWSGIVMLLDRSLDAMEIQMIENYIKAEKEVENYHYLKTRKSGDDVFIEAHIVFADKEISLKHAHDISEQIESHIMAAFPTSTVMLHLDLDAEPEHCNIKTKVCE